MTENNIPFNKPYLTGNETKYITEAVNSGHISGNGMFTKKCQTFFEEKYGFKKALMTTSCTDALEMCAMLVNIEPGDEVIVPSYTFVSTALAFVRQGAHIKFIDSLEANPNLDTSKIEDLITNKTKAIVVVHYAGVACEMDEVMRIADKHGIIVIEDAAQAIDSYYKGKPLGSIGHLAAFSFHETKNINSGEGGLLAINDEQYIKRAEIIWEKGTNRAEFFRGEINKYGWVDTGSSFLPSEIISAYLWAQLEELKNIQAKRKLLWDTYYNGLTKFCEEKQITMPALPSYATNNAHMFYLVCSSPAQRSELIKHLKSHGILSVFHYISLHSSEFNKSKHDGRELKNSDKYTNNLLRLPLYVELSEEQVNYVIEKIKSFVK